MAILLFDGHSHQLSLIGWDGKILGSWVAYNNVDSHAAIKALKNGVYIIQDKTIPHPHSANANGPYGLYGIIRFDVPGHPGIGVHSGRASARHLPGPEHPTMGCIRTTDAAMLSIKTLMVADHLATIEIRNSTPAMAVHATLMNQHRELVG